METKHPYLQLICLPKFYGAEDEWPEFKRIFEETTIQYNISPIHNILRLDEALQGKAAQCVSRLMLGASSLPKVMERLEMCFGTTEDIVPASGYFKFESSEPDQERFEIPATTWESESLSFNYCYAEGITNVGGHNQNYSWRNLTKEVREGKRLADNNSNETKLWMNINADYEKPENDVDDEYKHPRGEDRDSGSVNDFVSCKLNEERVNVLQAAPDHFETLSRIRKRSDSISEPLVKAEAEIVPCYSNNVDLKVDNFNEFNCELGADNQVTESIILDFETEVNYLNVDLKMENSSAMSIENPSYSIDKPITELRGHSDKEGKQYLEQIDLTNMISRQHDKDCDNNVSSKHLQVTLKVKKTKTETPRNKMKRLRELYKFSDDKLVEILETLSSTPIKFTRAKGKVNLSFVKLIKDDQEQRQRKTKFKIIGDFALLHKQHVSNAESRNKILENKESFFNFNNIQSSMNTSVLLQICNWQQLDELVFDRGKSMLGEDLMFKFNL